MPGQGGQQRGAAAGRLPWPAGGGGLVELGADVAFEAAELVAQRGGADAQAGAAAAMVGEAMAIWNRRSRCQPAGLSPAARRMSPRLVAGLGGAAGAR